MIFQLRRTDCCLTSKFFEIFLCDLGAFLTRRSLRRRRLRGVFYRMQVVSMFRLSLPCFFCTVCGIASGHEELLQIAAGLFHGIFAGDYRLGGAAVCFNAVSGERCKS